MTAQRTQVGVLAVVLLAVLVAIGCSDSEVISSGNVVVTFPASLDNLSSNNYDCIRMDYNFLRVKPADGVCSESAGEFAGLPCGTDTDCTDVNAACDPSFALGCNGGANNNQDCVTDTDCPDGRCLPRGECVTLGGMFTGQGCVSDLDCDTASGEKCAGRCSPGSSNPGGPCLTAGDCTTGECEGAQADDTLDGSDITLIDEGISSDGIPVYFTSECPACVLDNTSTPVLCNAENPLLACVGGVLDGERCAVDADCAPGGTCEFRCTNECRPREELEAEGIPCRSPNCCEKFALVAPPCTTNADCQVNECVDTAVPLSSTALAEGKYIITELRVSQLRMFSNEGDPPFISCTTAGSFSGQFDPPVEFEVGPGRTNQLRSIVDVTTLEGLLGLPGQPGSAGCTNAFSNLEEWLSIVSD